MNIITTPIAPPYRFPPFALSEYIGPDDWDKILLDLRAVEIQCGPNKNDRLATLIAVCLENRIDTMANIIGVLGPLGYGRKHIAIIVRLWTGSNPDRYWWTVDNFGKYQLIR